MTPREVRLPGSPLPVNSMTAAKPITRTTTIASSIPTALEVINPRNRVEAITRIAWTISIATVISLAVSSFSG